MQKSHLSVKEVGRDHNLQCEVWARENWWKNQFWFAEFSNRGCLVTIRIAQGIDKYKSIDQQRCEVCYEIISMVEKLPANIEVVPQVLAWFLTYRYLISVQKWSNSCVSLGILVICFTSYWWKNFNYVH